MTGPPGSLRRWLGVEPLGARRQRLGRWGEDLAAGFLRQLGYEILEANYRCPLGEVDLIARDGAALVFIEVRTRRSLAAGRPEESVTPQKQRRLARVALHYLSRQTRETACRFDVLAIDLSASQPPAEPPPAPDIKLFRDAFRP